MNNKLTVSFGETLLKLAAASVLHGLKNGTPLPVKAEDYTKELQENGASFVTLKLNGELRGCIGTVEAWRSLVEDIAENAYNAAFRDPRFSPLTENELDGLELSISILTKPEPMTFTDEANLLEQIKPEIDGLVIEDKGKRGLFLPIVWEQLPEKRDFLAHLKLKAGFPSDYWSSTLKIYRFRADAVKQKENSIWSA